MLCIVGVVLQSGQSGVGWVSGDILCKYDNSRGNLFVRSCAVLCGVQCSHMVCKGLFSVVNVWCWHV